MSALYARVVHSVEGKFRMQRLSFAFTEQIRN